MLWGAGHLSCFLGLLCGTGCSPGGSFWGHSGFYLHLVLQEGGRQSPDGLCHMGRPSTVCIVSLGKRRPHWPWKSLGGGSQRSQPMMQALGLCNHLQTQKDQSQSDGD